MSTQNPRAQITATVTIVGPADELLADLQRLARGRREVSLSVEVPRRHYRTGDFHSFPRIKGGQIQDALEKLDKLCQQTVLSEETAGRLDRLIRDYGRLTE